MEGSLKSPIMGILESASNAAKSDLPCYIVDGIEYCEKCHSPRQKRLTILGSERIVNMLCTCQKEKLENEQSERKRAEEAARVNRNISIGMRDISYRKMTFESSDTDLKRERNYCEQFPKMQEMNTGLMFIGEVGTGKTFRAACIANQLLRNGYTVYMDNITSLCSELQEHFSDRQEYIRAITQNDLLVLDDIGAERRTEFMIELIYNIIDSRYRAQKPLIITSNITPAEMMKEQDIRLLRTYDRLREMCSFPIILNESSKRKAIGNSNYLKVKELLENGI